eukprot:c13810_g1_i1 orf=147-446(+)
MVYEANARVRDPVYGCVGAISSLQQQVAQLQTQVALAQAEIVCLRMQQAASFNTLIDSKTPASTASPPLASSLPDWVQQHKTLMVKNTEELSSNDVLWS